MESIEDVLKFWNECSIRDCSRKRIFNNPKNSKYKDSLIYHTKFLKETASIRERIYCLENKITMQSLCTCGNLLKYRGGNNGYNLGCCNKCAQLHPLTKKHIQDTCIKRYNCTNGGASKQAREKIRETCLKHHGVEYAWQAQQTKDTINKTLLEKYNTINIRDIPGVEDKIKETNLERYGCEYGLANKDIIQKGIDTCRQKYNVNHPMELQEVKDKIKETNLERYGWEYASQSDEYNTVSYRYKWYIFPSGKYIKVQGYENYALDYLLKTYSEDELVTDIKEMTRIFGSITFKNPYNKNGRGRYFPDIYIKSTNTIIEVKSIYTFYNNFEINLRKESACLRNGLNFNFMIFEPKKQLMPLSLF